MSVSIEAVLCLSLTVVVASTTRRLPLSAMLALPGFDSAPTPSLLVQAGCLEPSIFDKGSYRNCAYGAGLEAGPIIRSTAA